MLVRFANVTAYLDVMDPHLRGGSAELTEHLRNALDECTHLLAAVSDATKLSWWVPFEIGLATEKDYPISTFGLGSTQIPDYLQKWPYLRTEPDFARYVRVALAGLPSGPAGDLRKAGSTTRATYSRLFHQNLKRELGQR